MGVRNNKFFVYGNEVPVGTMYNICGDDWEKEESLRLEYLEKGDFGFVSGDDYEVYGILLSKYDDEGNDIPGGIIDTHKMEEELIEKNRDRFEKDRIEVMKKSKELFGKVVIPHVMLINHYS